MTEEELVEKVARAIWASEYISTFPDIPLLETERETVMGQARAAIAAMREAENNMYKLALETWYRADHEDAITLRRAEIGYILGIHKPDYAPEQPLSSLREPS